MLKLVRAVLTAAVLAAIVVRLRRRSSGARPEPVAQPAPVRGRSWTLWAALVAAALVLGGCAQFFETWTFAKPTAAVAPAGCAGSECKYAIFVRERDSPEPADTSDPEPVAPDPSPLEPVDSDGNVDYVPDFPREAGCDPPVRAPAVRPVTAKVRKAVDRQWRRIEAWLRVHAPRTHARLAPPASPGDIAKAEAKLGLRFPDSLRASLLRHDGSSESGFGFLGHWNMSVEEIVHTWTMMCEIDPGDEGDPRNSWWSSRMIPFGDFGDGGNLVLDSVVGDVGWYFNEEGTSFAPEDPWRRSYYALLKWTADVLEKGGDLDGWVPEVEEGELAWELPD
ncbi:SMI1/KNR4 family protein [Nonomuraea sp. NPDC050556]|uniref:SMI1/KNR4 family protein n=1 Tax=Nonomuraea sp. NPDC050556 TaxID=3364369 RepID=UPI00379BB2C7